MSKTYKVVLLDKSYKEVYSHFLDSEESVLPAIMKYDDKFYINYRGEWAKDGIKIVEYIETNVLNLE